MLLELALVVGATTESELPARAADRLGAAGAPAPRKGVAAAVSPTGDSHTLARLMTGVALKRKALSGTPDSLRSTSRVPGAALSRYLRTTSTAVTRAAGCSFGRRARRNQSMQDLLVVLDFGGPAHRHGHWGTTLFGSGFRSTDRIASAAQAYAAGFWRCSGHRPLRLRVAIGTSNYGRQVTRSHGRAWAGMVNRANAWLARHGYRSKITFAGADDIELGWNGPRASRAWVAGYDGVADWPFYDYGDAGACPPAGNCLGRWALEDVWYVSWGARTAWPLPEIYSPSGVNARQWHALSLYSLHHHGYPIRFAGALSQLTACRQSNDPCRGTRNSPTRAWTLLWRVLNADPRTAQPLRWSSDMSW